MNIRGYILLVKNNASDFIAYQIISNVNVEVLYSEISNICNILWT